MILIRSSSLTGIQPKISIANTLISLIDQLISVHHKKNMISSSYYLLGLTSSNRIQSPSLKARRKGPSLQAKMPPAAPSTGKSAPKRSDTSVWSDRLILVTACPDKRASAATRLVFPTPTNNILMLFFSVISHFVSKNS